MFLTHALMSPGEFNMYTLHWVRKQKQNTSGDLVVQRRSAFSGVQETLRIAVNLWYSAAISYFGTMLVKMAISSIPQKGRRYALMYLITSLLPSIDQLESNSQPGLES